MLAGYLRLPNGWVLAPMFIAMALTFFSIELSAMPDWLSKGAQLLIGWSLGDRFRPGFFSVAPRFLVSVIGYTASALLFAFGFACLLAGTSDIALSVLVLGIAPGGIAEMAITAKVLQLGAPLVTVFQLSRMVTVVVCTGPLFNLATRLKLIDSVKDVP